MLWGHPLPFQVEPKYTGRHRAPKPTRRARVAHSELQVLTTSSKALLRHFADGRTAGDAKALAHMDAVDMRLAMAVAR